MAYAARQDLVDRFGADEIDDLAPAPADLKDASATLAEDGEVTIADVPDDSDLEEALDALRAGDLIAITADGAEILREVAARPVDDGGTWTVDTVARANARADLALADAAAEIDAALAVGYSLPLLPTWTYPALVAIACDLARLRLYDDAVPAEAVLGRANRSRARLRDIAEGRSALVDSAGNVVARRIEPSATLGARAADVKPSLGRDALKGY